MQNDALHFPRLSPRTRANSRALADPTRGHRFSDEARVGDHFLLSGFLILPETREVILVEILKPGSCAWWGAGGQRQRWEAWSQE